MKEAEIRDSADVCRMLADSTRLSIVALLAQGQRSVGRLCRELDLTHPLVSYHLALLRMSGLVDRKRKGKQMFYSLNRSKLEPARVFLAKMK